jgi:hypothetical protein
LHRLYIFVKIEHVGAESSVVLRYQDQKAPHIIWGQKRKVLSESGQTILTTSFLAVPSNSRLGDSAILPRDLNDILIIDALGGWLLGEKFPCIYRQIESALMTARLPYFITRNELGNSFAHLEGIGDGLLCRR